MVYEFASMCSISLAVAPLIVNYSASTVPIIQLALSGKGLTEQALTDLA